MGTRGKGIWILDISDIEYSFDATDVICSQMQYLCLEFAQGDDPRQKGEPLLNFTVEGVIDRYDLSPAPDNLVGCGIFPACNGKVNYI